MKKFTFKCGCEFEIIENEKEIRINLNPDIEKIPLTCERTWAIFTDGDVRGTFQLEKQARLSKQVAPKSILELSDLISILRPGCSEAIVDGKSITNHYIDRKHNREEVTYYHDALIPSLKTTYGLLVYQEQSMQIAKDIAGFNLQEADSLRKAIGKKNTAEMSKLKGVFVDRATEMAVVTRKEAEEIFSWIEKAQRYSFNLSHGVSYAFNAYLAAYCKAHFIRPFFTSYLLHSKDKAKQSEEVRPLVNNAKEHGISVVVPDFRRIDEPSSIPGLRPALNYMLRDKKIYIGIGDIKDVGESAVRKMVTDIEDVEKFIKKSREDWTWLDFLLFCAPKTNKKPLEAMVGGGCFSCFNISRTKMLYEYRVMRKLKEKELAYCQKLYLGGNFPTLQSILETLVSIGSGKQTGISNVNRLKDVKDIILTLESPGRSLEDAPDWIAGTEESLYGIPITCSRVDSRNAANANCTCHEFTQGYSGYALIAAQIQSVHEIKTKNGKNPGQKMAFLIIEDSSGALDNVVVFPEDWAELRGLLVEGNIVLIGGDGGKDSSLIVKKAWQI